MGSLMRKMMGTVGPIKNGVPSDALIESIAETGMTMTSPSVGPDAPVYKLGLRVTPIGGAGDPYLVEIKETIPRIFVPMVLPGARIGVLIDPTDPMKVGPDFSRFGFNMNFDASGQPSMADVSAVASGVVSGQVKTIKGSADRLLATATHGTAIVTTAMPLGKTVRDINPAADPSRLNDPVWLFTLEVTVAGEAPFPAVFGHRVPLAKVAAVAP
jgi:hypothetical protein